MLKCKKCNFNVYRKYSWDDSLQNKKSHNCAKDSQEIVKEYKHKLELQLHVNKILKRLHKELTETLDEEEIVLNMDTVNLIAKQKREIRDLEWIKISSFKSLGEIRVNK